MPNNTQRPTRTQRDRWLIKAAIAYLKRIHPKPKQAWGFCCLDDYVAVARHHGFTL